MIAHSLRNLSMEKSFRMLALSFFFLMVGASVRAEEDPVVATVNGQNILKSTFEQIYRQDILYLSTQHVTKEKVLNDIINRILGIEKAKSEKLAEDKIVKTKMEDVLYHAQVSKDLEPLLKKIEVTDKDVEKYYKENKEYRTAHILFRMQANPGEEESKAALNQALDVYDKVKKEPSKFSEFANKFSQSTAAPNGGDLGFLPPPRLAPEYYKAIKGKNAGYTTSPIRTQFGYHLVKILAIKDYEHINKDLYKKIIYDMKRDELMEKYFSDLRKNASVKINEKALE